MATRYIQGNNEVQGSNDGVAPAAGYVGESKKATVLPGTNQSLTTGYTLITGATLSLEAGIWFIFANVNYEGLTSGVQIGLELHDGTAQVTFNEVSLITGGGCSLSHVVNINTTKTYSLRTRAATAIGVVTGFSRPQFIAVRIG